MILICLLFVSIIIIYFCHLMQNFWVSRHKSKKLKVPERKTVITERGRFATEMGRINYCTQNNNKRKTLLKHLLEWTALNTDFMNENYQSEFRQNMSDLRENIWGSVLVIFYTCKNKFRTVFQLMSIFNIANCNGHVI